MDSGSSHTFISTSVAQYLSGVQPLHPVVSVQVTNGVVLHCDFHIPTASWIVQSFSFLTDLKLLPLSSYDMILGLDWLTSFNPMQVHWGQRWISIPYQGSTAILLDNAPDLPVGSVIQLCSVQDQAPTIPVVVQDLVNEFAHLFEPPAGLPPSHTCDHSIPLIQGA